MLVPQNCRYFFLEGEGRGRGGSRVSVCELCVENKEQNSVSRGEILG